ncbi:MAG TPA: 5-(carboxyamino)imidazole ribonucleotide synthase [Pseudomonadales bacterium]|nr:5-(carboxyamino)imidazole ribonucleotide synthase [Pseudomonadales bacterium]
MKIGVLGGGQLGRMMALAGLPLNLEFCFWDDAAEPCAAPLGRVYKSHELDQFIAAADLVTYEFENVPLDIAQRVAAVKPLHPSVEALRISQHRIREKSTFQALGIPTPDFAEIHSPDELKAAVTRVGLPCVVKTATQGYDGKGQWVIRSEADFANVDFSNTPLIAEQFIRFERELSLVGVKSVTGELAFYPLVENTHENGILRTTIAPAPGVDSTLEKCAQDYLSKLFDHLGYAGVLTLELFQTSTGLIANEMAPRVHNSGHWTMDGAVTSQFENHLRAILGLPLGQTQPHHVAAMVNILGDVPDEKAVFAVPGTRLHLYGKSPKKNRKIGHINLTAQNYEALQARVQPLLALTAASNQ